MRSEDYFQEQCDLFHVGALVDTLFPEFKAHHFREIS